MEGRALLFVGPDGSGRFTLAQAIGITLQIPIVVSYTTRPPRLKEIDGKDYHFVSMEQFKTIEANGEFLEVVEADGNYYGIKKEDCESLVHGFGSFFAILSPKGCEFFKKIFENTLTIFVYADKETVIKRQEERGDDPATIERHMKHYDEVMTYKDQCDIVIPNHDLASTAQELTKRIENYLEITHHPDSKY